MADQLRLSQAPSQGPDALDRLADFVLASTLPSLASTLASIAISAGAKRASTALEEASKAVRGGGAPSVSTQLGWSSFSLFEKEINRLSASLEGTLGTSALSLLKETHIETIESFVSLCLSPLKSSTASLGSAGGCLRGLSELLDFQQRVISSRIGQVRSKKLQIFIEVLSSLQDAYLLFFGREIETSFSKFSLVSFKGKPTLRSPEYFSFCSGEISKSIHSVPASGLGALVSLLGRSEEILVGSAWKALIAAKTLTVVDLKNLEGELFAFGEIFEFSRQRLEFPATKFLELSAFLRLFTLGGLRSFENAAQVQQIFTSVDFKIVKLLARKVEEVRSSEAPLVLSKDLKAFAKLLGA